MDKEVRVRLLLLLTYTTIPCNGSEFYLQDGRRAMRIMPFPELFLARKGAAIFTDTELVPSVDCDSRDRGTAPEIVTSSGSSLDGPALRQVYGGKRGEVQRSVRRFRSIILIKSLIKSFPRRAIGRRTDFNLINATSGG